MKNKVVNIINKTNKEYEEQYPIRSRIEQITMEYGSYGSKPEDYEKLRSLRRELYKLLELAGIKLINL